LAVDVELETAVAVELRAVELSAVEFRAVELRAVELRAVELAAVKLAAVEFEALACEPFPAFDFFAVALVEASSSVAASLAAFSFSGERANTSVATLCQL
jgi:hypothetical protein